MRVTNQVIKHNIVIRILDNPTYTNRSGLWSRLYKVLMKISKDDLCSLELLLRQKEREVYEGIQK